MTTSIIRTATGLALAAVFAVGIVASAEADTPWQKDHPRRHEVNHRLNHQDKRIHWELKTGQITKSQAVALHKDDAKIRHQERVDASQHGGHITLTEKHALNQQENGVSKQIGQ